MVEKGKNNKTGSPEVSLKELDEDECADVEHFNYESLYHVDENIDDLSDLDDEFDKARQPNIQEQNNMGRYEEKLGGNDLYFESLDPECDISEDERDHVESDEVVDPPSRNASTKRSTKNYCIQKGVNLKQKPNEKERIRAKCKKGFPWHILGNVDGSTVNFILKTYFPIHKCCKRTRNK
ncbi:hypothetical protein KY289_008461 [Solanum tuberosum]|nr:hypothetical protein KY289_008461 [Solanum tuberosum]